MWLQVPVLWAAAAGQRHAVDAQGILPRGDLDRLLGRPGNNPHPIFTWSSPDHHLNPTQSSPNQHLILPHSPTPHQIVSQMIGELETLGHKDDTVIALVGDHGWQLGEHNIWGKHTNFELGTRTHASNLPLLAMPISL